MVNAATVLPSRNFIKSPCSVDFYYNHVNLATSVHFIRRSSVLTMARLLLYIMGMSLNVAADPPGRICGMDCSDALSILSKRRTYENSSYKCVACAGRLLYVAMALYAAETSPAAAVTSEALDALKKSMQVGVDTVWVLFTAFLVFFMNLGFRHGGIRACAGPRTR